MGTLVVGFGVRFLRHRLHKYAVEELQEKEAMMTINKNYKTTGRQIRCLLGAVAVLLAAGVRSAVAYSTNDDLPGPSAHMTTIPAGSLVIPMDNTLQAIVSPFNLKAYGLANDLLQHQIPLKWAIKAGKAKDATDFTASAFRFAPTAGATSSVSFAGGPFIIHKNFATLAKARITAFGNSVAVYQLTNDVSVDIRYDIAFKPHPAVNVTNATIHTDLLDFAGITNYDVIADASLLSNSCYTVFMEPHNSSTNGVKAVKDYLQSGGNFIAECEAVLTYENATKGHLQVATSVTGDDINTTLVYSNVDLSFNQFVGTVDRSPGGSLEDWTKTGAFINGGHMLMGAVSGGVQHYTATASKLYNGPGGMAFYLGGHDYGAGGSDITLINGQRMILNAVFVPNTRDVSCGFTINSTPTANNDTGTTSEDTPLVVAAPGVLSNDSDAESNTLFAVSATSPSHGTVLLSTNGAYTYTPTNNYNGADSFTYKVTDGNTTSTTATVSLTITAVNDAPTVTNLNLTTVEDTAKAITLTGFDVEGSNLTYVVASNPSHGALSGVAPSLTYTPATNYNGADSFTYRVTDGQLTSGVSTVSITVTPVNDMPTVTNQTVVTGEDTAAGVTLTGTDVDGDALIYLIVANPTHGGLSGVAPSLTYTPTLNYNGADSFTYRVTDGLLTSSVATVSITVTPINDAPTVTNLTVTTAEDTAKSITLTGSDIESNALTFTVLSGPSHGVLSGTAPNLTYTPTNDYNGADSFTFKANDGSLDSGTATVSITITPVNDQPTVDAQSVSTPEDTALPVTLTGSDIDGDGLTYSVVTGPSHGVLSGTEPNLTYTPNLNYNGPDSFTFKANDGTVDSAPATISITVSAVNDAPVAVGDSYGTDEDVALTVDAPGVLGNDTDAENDAINAVLVTTTTHGLLVLNPDGSFTYTPSQDYNGPDSFSYKANDGSLNSTPVTVNLTIGAVNDVPVANNDAYGTAEDTALTVDAPGVLGNDTDVENDTLTATVVDNPSHGSVTLNPDGSFTYTPDFAYNGSDSFTYIANDGQTNSSLATVTLNVTSVNDTPVAAADSYSTDEDTTLTVDAPGVMGNDTDVDLDPLTASLVTGPAHGSLTFGTNGSFEYTPDANYNGPDSFTYKVNDGTVDSGVAVVTLTVNAVNDAPVASDDAYGTAEDTLLTVDAPGVLVNDSDVEGDVLTAVVVSNPSHGSLTLNANGSFTYLPDANYSGPDSFTYMSNDGQTDSVPATVTLSISSVNDAPVANNDSFGTDEDTPLIVAAPGLLSNDTDTENDALTAVLVDGPSHGTVDLHADGSFTYTPDADYNGADSFTYKSNDGIFDSGNATVFLVVNAVNDAPTVADSTPNVDEDSVLNVTAPGALTDAGDIDGDDYTAFLVDGPSHGSLTFNPDGSYTYTPEANYNGPDSFTFAATDGVLTSSVGTVSITVNPVNDTPTVVGSTPSVDEDDTLTVPAPGALAGSGDIDGDELTAILITNVTHGTLTLNPDGSYVYTPEANYNGVDCFTFAATDGIATSSFAQVCITVDPVNDAPTAVVSAQSVNEDDVLTISAPGVLTGAGDIDGDSLTAVHVGGPSHGSLTLNPDGSYTYTPDANYNGQDSFTFASTDGVATSATTTVSITVNPVNDAPTATPQSVSTDEDTAKSITLGGADIDGDGLTYSVVTGPSHGTLSGAAPNLTYTPDADYNGPDSFTFKSNDGLLDSAPATISITVAPVNDNPVAVNDDSTVVGNSGANEVDVLVNDTDIDGDELTVASVTQGAHGSVSITGGGTTVSYTPGPNYSGSDSFTYTISDGNGGTATATVTMTITPGANIPTAVDDDYTLGLNQTLDTCLGGPGSDCPLGVIHNDIPVGDGPLTAILVTQPSHGTLTFHADGTFTYVPEDGFAGVDSFTYKVNDGTNDSNIATVTITIPSIEGVSDAELYARSMAFTVNWAAQDADSFSISGKVNPRGADVDLTGATVQISVNGTNIFAPVVLTSAGSGALTVGSATAKVKFSSSTGTYSYKLSKADLADAIGLGNITAAGTVEIEVKMVIANAGLDVSTVKGLFETPFQSTQDKASKGKFAFKSNRCLTGVFNANKTAATELPNGSFKFTTSGVIEGSAGVPVIPTGDIRVTIGSATFTLPEDGVTLAIAGVKHTFKLTANGLFGTGIPSAGIGSPIVHEVPVVLEIPVTGGTNVFQSTIELKRTDGSATAWKR